MRSHRSSTCTYGLPGQASHLFERTRSTLRQSSYARARGVASPPSTKRKLQSRDDDDEPIDETNGRSSVQHPGSRVVIDEFGNRVLVDGLKRMRVSSPPTVPTAKTTDEDMTMDDSDSDVDATSIVPLHRAATTTNKVPTTLVPPVKRAMEQHASVPTFQPDSTDPACRAMVLFDPYQALTVERSPRIQLVHDSDADKSGSESEHDEPFVRFEELPDDYEAEPEAMELD